MGLQTPLPVNEIQTFNDDAIQLNKARKHAKKQFRRCAAVADDPIKFKKRSKTYLASRRCLIAAMWESNKKQPVRKRNSVHQIIQLSGECKILNKLDEDVVVRFVPKKSGKGIRAIHDFGPVARAAQRIVRDLLRLRFSVKNVDD